MIEQHGLDMGVLSRAILQGPSVIKEITERVGNCEDPYNTHNTTIQTFEENGLTLSLKQAGILDASLPAFAEHRKAILAAQALTNSSPKSFRQFIAQQLDCPEKAITQIIFHPLSVTIGLTAPTFKQAFRSESEEDFKNRKSRYPAAFTSTKLKMPLEGSSLPYSLSDDAYIGSKTADHENQHTEYRYFHPAWATTDIIDPQEYHQGLTKRSQEAIAVANEKSFKELVQEITRAQLSLYLNELAATATSGESAYGYFWEQNRIYYNRFQANIKALRQGLPKNIDARLPWEKIIFQETQSLKQKMRYIDNGYYFLKLKDLPTADLVSTVEFLTPEHGYLISAYSDPDHTGPITLANIREWRKTYHYTENKILKKNDINSWTDFLLLTIGAEDYKNYSQIRKNLRKTVKKSENFFNQESVTEEEKAYFEQGGDFDREVERSIADLKMVAQRRSRKLLKILGSDFLDANIDPKYKQFIIRTVLCGTVDFQNVFRLFVYHCRDLGFSAKPGHRDQYGDIIQRITQRSLSLDDAAEELAEEVAELRRPKYNLIFNPSFKRTHKQRKRMFQAIDSLQRHKISKLSPLEDEVLILYNSLYLNKVVPIKYNFTVPLDEYEGTISSALVRLSLWAKETNLKKSQTKAIQELLKRVRHAGDLPSFYKITFPEIFNP